MIYTIICAWLSHETNILWRFSSPSMCRPRAFPEDVQEAITTECQAKYHAYAVGEPGNLTGWDLLLFSRPSEWEFHWQFNPEKCVETIVYAMNWLAVSSCFIEFLRLLSWDAFLLQVDQHVCRGGFTTTQSDCVSLWAGNEGSIKFLKWDCLKSTFSHYSHIVQIDL